MKDQTHPLDVLFEKSCILAERVDAGELGFIDAVDMSWTASEFSGLVHRFGPDAVQICLARAFMHVKRGVA